MVWGLSDLLDAWITTEEVGPDNMGRAAPKIESLEDVIAALELDASLLQSEGEAHYTRLMLKEEQLMLEELWGAPPMPPTARSSP